MTSNSNSGDRGGRAGGFVPALGANPATAPYELLTAAQAAARVAAVGFDRADAERMVAEYLDGNTAEFGRPPGEGWRVDPYDLAEIARRYEWVDHYRGETIDAARERAGEYAAGWTARSAEVDRDRDPHTAARIDQQIEQWTDRATRPQDRADDHVAPVILDASGFYSDAQLAAIAQARAAGDVERAERVVPVMPEWMAAQARRTEADITAGTDLPARPDDPAELVARYEILRYPTGRTEDGAEGAARRDQLTRWHHVDHTSTDGQVVDEVGDVEVTDVGMVVERGAVDPGDGRGDGPGWVQ